VVDGTSSAVTWTSTIPPEAEEDEVRVGLGVLSSA
jgi:hypothetical protein